MPQPTPRLLEAIKRVYPQKGVDPALSQRELEVFRHRQKLGLPESSWDFYRGLILYAAKNRHRSDVVMVW